jgi:hypothetical protein
VSAAYHCSVCAAEILRTATHVATEHAHVLCVPCAEDPASHAVVHPGCPVAPHGVYDHAVVVGTRLGAHRALLRNRRAREVAQE